MLHEPHCTKFLVGMWGIKIIVYGRAELVSQIHICNDKYYGKYIRWAIQIILL